MPVLHLVLVSGFALYILFTIFFITGLLRLKKHPKAEDPFPKVSVVAAARNEEDSLPALLDDLSRQDYPQDKISFVIADDRSEDKTWDIIQEKAQADSRFSGVKIEDLNPDMTPKKYALTNAIQQSGGDIILSTDADCRVPDGWAKSMAHALSSENGIVIGLSTVNTDKKSFFNSYQFIDFLGIMAANAGALGWGTGWSGSGQNLGYTRKQFEKIDGFTPVGNLLSGDDMYLVQSISSRAKAVFNLDSAGFATTLPAANVSSFLSQRIRWASNAKPSLMSRPVFFIFLLSAFLANAGVFAGLFFDYAMHLVPLVFGTKVVFEAGVMFTGAARFGMKIPILPFLGWSVLQPIYIPVVGLFGLIGKFRWKS
mgnify:FL=1|jgi:cellulose synthase/poly-beta-1,6-N-acetylglucosamine synthase-like glycosyltransferase